MKIIGLTGGIASGKSTASTILKKLGASIVDADILARKAVKKGQPALEKIIDTFGIDIINDQGELNREKLGEIVFSSQEKLQALNQIVHPAVHTLLMSSFDKERAKGKKKIVYDCPLLIEENLQHLVDETWLIYVDQETQLKRLIQRNNFSEEEALKRIHSQMPLEQKIKHADIVIDNNSTIENLEKILRKHWYK